MNPMALRSPYSDSLEEIVKLQWALVIASTTLDWDPTRPDVPLTRSSSFCFDFHASRATAETVAPARNERINEVLEFFSVTMSRIVGILAMAITMQNFEVRSFVPRPM